MTNILPRVRDVNALIKDFNGDVNDPTGDGLNGLRGSHESCEGQEAALPTGGPGGSPGF